MWKFWLRPDLPEPKYCVIWGVSVRLF
jgi:hypothetical protein